jgi:GTP-binding protein
MPQVFALHENWGVKVKTKDLNDWLAMAVQRHPPPAVNGRRIKTKYMAQIKARPPTFVLFASRAADLPDQYRRYLVNSMRESFDLPGVPIRISMRSNKNPYADESDGARKQVIAAYPVSKNRHIPAAATIEAGDEPAPAPKPKPKAKPKAGKAEPKSTRVKSLKPAAKQKKAQELKAMLGVRRKTVPRIPTTHKLRKPGRKSRPTPRT